MPQLRTGLIDNYVTRLAQALGPVRDPPDIKALREYFADKRYADMFLVIKKHMRLDMKLRVGFVRNNYGPTSMPAWIEMPAHVPLYGTREFKNLRITIYIRKSFLSQIPFETTVEAMAHELAHIVLDAIRHPLRREEEAVDLTAMILGYADFFVTGCTFEQQSIVKPRPWWKKVLGYPQKTVKTERHLGYLSPDEVRYAADLIKKLSSA